MKKLLKRNLPSVGTIQAYACACNTCYCTDCTLGCGCKTSVFLLSSDRDVSKVNTNNDNKSHYGTAANYRK